jgi:hypothetical protein
MDPLDGEPQPGRQKQSVGIAALGLIEAVSVLCGEGFITHDEHEQIILIGEQAAQRWIEAKEALERLDFEP